MPRGFRRGRGHRGRRWRVMRFVQPCLLVLLHQEEAHGYRLLDGLEDFGFDVRELDPSIVYRALRELEESGLVTSSWDAEESQGPQRRVYRITAAGEEALSRWVEDLKRTRDEINALLERYENLVE